MSSLSRFLIADCSPDHISPDYGPARADAPQVENTPYLSYGR
jgi:hypothetical protein